MCCVLIAVLQLWLKESDDYEEIMVRTADPRLEKVLALIDKGVSPQTARNRHTIALHNDVLRWHILPYAMDVERSVRKDPTR